MSEKRTVGLIFGVVAIAAVGGLVYFFKVYQPGQTRGVAQREIEAWEGRLASVRGCLLGPAPASAKSGEALAVRELSPDPWDRTSCTQLIGKLSRGLADDSGMMNVEHAWMTIDRAAGHVASAFATHVDPSGEAPGKRGKESPLPAALDELDDARAQLRAAAGMDAPPPLASATLPAAEELVLKDGLDRVTTLTAWTIPSAGGEIAFGAIGDRAEVQLTLVPGAPPKVSRIPAGALRAVPDGSWGAAGLREEVAIGTIDARGAFGQMTHLPVELGARVGIAVGSFTNGLVAYAASNHLVISRAQGGAFAADKPIEAGQMAFALDPGGRGLVAWLDPTKLAEGDTPRLLAFLAKDGAPPQIVQLGEGAPTGACLTAKGAWIAGAPQFLAFDGTAARSHLLPEHELLGCGPDAALLHRYDSTHFAVCGDTCRLADLTGLRPTNLATLVAGKVTAIHTRGRVIGVWTEGKPPRFFTTTKAVTPKLVYANTTSLEILASTDEGLLVVRLPIR